MIDDEVGPHTTVTVLAYWKFESVSLQQTVRLSPGFASVRGKARVFSHYADRAGRQWSAETRKAQQRRAKQRWSLCRAIFQYRSATGCGSRYRRWPRAKSFASGQRSRWSFEF
jgi:hypothetical protein